MKRITSFEDLECWKSAVELRKELKSFISQFPPEEKYRLTDQIIRCSRSVTNNIAEGFGRYHYLENAKFCRNSRGSLMELADHFIVAEECGYITNEQLKEIKNKIQQTNLILNGYINYLVKANTKNDH